MPGQSSGHVDAVEATLASALDAVPALLGAGAGISLLTKYSGGVIILAAVWLQRRRAT